MQPQERQPASGHQQSSTAARAAPKQQSAAPAQHARALRCGQAQRKRPRQGPVSRQNAATAFQAAARCKFARASFLFATQRLAAFRAHGGRAAPSDAPRATTHLARLAAGTRSRRRTTPCF
jgi:hypothetical protein